MKINKQPIIEEEQLSVTIPTKKKRKMVIVLIFAFLFVVLAGMLIRTKLHVSTSDKSATPSSTAQSPNIDNFFYFSIPKSLEKLTVYDLPNDGGVGHVFTIGNTLWFIGSGSIIEYDTKKQSIVSYSDPRKANCSTEMVSIEKYLYAVCAVDNIDDAFGHTQILHGEVFAGHNGILKINPATHKVEHVFTKSDGLLNQFNYRLYPDGDYLWVATFDGVGRINTKTSHVDFYKQELGVGETSGATNRFSIYPIVVDKDYVWIANLASVESQGGIALFNKATSKWTIFGPHQLKDHESSRLDLENTAAIKLVEGGVQIGFRDGVIGGVGGNDRFVEKKYSYTTGKWTKVGQDRPITGEFYEKTAQYIQSTYPLLTPVSYQQVDQDGLIQIKLSDSGKTYQLDGRDSYTLSPVINNKRYLLTSATIDVIDSTYPFRQVLVKLGNRLETGVGYSDLNAFQGLTKFLVDPVSLLAIVVDSECGGQGCRGTQKVWLIDLKDAKVIKKYVGKQQGVPGGELLMTIESMSKDGNTLIIKDKNGKSLFTIDAVSQILTPTL